MSATRRESLRTRFGGADPGRDGWLVVYDGRKVVQADRIPWLARIPNRAEIRRIFLEWKDLGVALACVELQQTIGKQSAAGAMTMGRGYEALLMGLECAEVPAEEPDPTLWKPRMGIRTTKPKAPALRKRLLKERSVARCQALIPGYDLRATPNCKGPDHNKAEACLLAVYAQRVYLGEARR